MLRVCEGYALRLSVGGMGRVRRLLQIPMIGAAYLGFAEGDVDFWCCLEVVGIILCIIRRQ